MRYGTEYFDESERQEREKQEAQAQQDQHHQLQRDLADAISRLASLDDIRILLAGGARVDGPVTQGLHPIHYAAYQNFVPAARLLILRGCDINAMDDNGYTPVHLGAERGYYDLLKFLISNGAKVCFTDVKKQKSNFTTMADEPLSLALKRGHLDCAELLLKNGADPNAKYFMGSEINLVGILKVSGLKLLLDYGAKPDSRDRSGLTPLMKAARHPQGYATVKLLIDYGADVNDIAGERHDYRTVLHHSIFSGNLDIIRLILISGARYPKLNFDKPSPMDIAIISGRFDIAKLLIEFDADVNAGSDSTIGQPLQTALTQRFENKREIVKLLLDNNADPNSFKTSNRNTGPPLHDYLHSVRQISISSNHHNYHQNNNNNSNNNQHQQNQSEMRENSPAARFMQRERANNRDNNNNHHYNQQQLSTSSLSGSPCLDMVRLLMMYGARIVLKTPTQHPLGLVRTLERIQEDLSIELLNLLIDAAEEIDWFMMSKVIYSCLRQTNRSRTNELFDPSVSADMTPERLSLILADEGAHHHGLSDGIIRLMNNGKAPSSVLSLKQISRIHLRRHLTTSVNLQGLRLIKAISGLPLPKVLIRYLLYQD